MSDLKRFGWNDTVQRAWNELDVDVRGLSPARVIADFGTSLKIAVPESIPAELSGKLAHYTDKEHVPKVGDWVATRLLDSGSAIIESIVPRNNEIARKVAGKRVQKQIIASNVDVAFVLLAMDNDFSVERLRRFLYQLSISSIKPVIVLNKSDKTDDIDSFSSQLHEFAVPIIILSALHGRGVDEVISYIAPGHTAILLGSSGVGKSTLTNALLGRDVQQTHAIRESDSTGVHTTVHRELFVLPHGGLLIDSPGVREFQLWGTEEDLDDNFDDIIDSARKCKYTNCGHTTEKGCAVRDALESGALDRSHYVGYLKMRSELRALDLKTAERIRREKLYRKKISRTISNTMNFDEDD